LQAKTLESGGRWLLKAPEKLFLLAHVTRAYPVSSCGRNQRKDSTMTEKLDPLAAAPSLMKTWMSASLAVTASLEPALTELVKIRASQLNGCANCINMHAAEARAKGETEQRIYLLSAWREAPCYTDRERAALAWTDALTQLSQGHTHEAAYEGLKAQFSEEEQVKLTLVINVINGWNRLAVGFGVWREQPAAKAA
jgi:AhpD family alkylhydroperoxidase